MLTFLLLVMLAGSIPYLAVGARVARHQHALAMHNYRLALGQTQTKAQERINAEKRIVELEFKQTALPHKSYCHLMYQALKAQGCRNCPSSTEWHNLRVQIEQLRKIGKLTIVPPEPSPPYGTMLLWPVVKLEDYLTSGEVAKANPYKIAELEKELSDIPELQ